MCCGQHLCLFLLICNYECFFLYCFLCGIQPAIYLFLLKINVIGPNQDTTSYVDQLNTGYTYATFTDFASEDGIYSISISGINWLDVETVPVSTNVTVLTVPPKIMQGKWASLCCKSCL